MALIRFLLYFSFAHFLTTFSDGSVCKEVRTLHLVDCSGLGVSKLPKFSGRLKWVVTVNLRRNLITDIRERELLSVFPGVVLVDLRGNPINCKELATFHRVRVLTNCVVALSPSFGASDTTYIRTSTVVLLSTKCQLISNEKPTDSYSIQSNISSTFCNFRTIVIPVMDYFIDDLHISRIKCASNRPTTF